MIITVEAIYKIIEGTAQTLSSQTSVALSEVYGNSEGQIFQDKIQACRHVT